MISKRKLVIHFDLNETIIVEDLAGGDSVNDCLNKILAKNALIKRNLTGAPKFWRDCTEIGWEQKQIPPALFDGWQWPLDCEPYYKAFKSKSKTFTSHDGAIYQSTLHEMRQKLLFQNHPTDSIDHRLTKDGGKSHFILPAFFECLYQLEKSQRDYTVVLRTFGNDLPLVADAIQAFAEGKHPLYPSFHSQTLRLPRENMYRGRYCNPLLLPEGGGNGGAEDRDSLEMPFFRLHEWTDHDETDGSLLGRVVAQNDHEILSILEQQRQSFKVFGINDDYHFWSQNKCKPNFGKPIWVRHPTVSDSLNEQPLHIFFDDNIKNDPLDSIVAVRYQHCSSKDFQSLDGERIQTLHGRYLVRVPTYMPIFQPSWFFEQIEKCERNVIDNPYIT